MTRRRALRWTITPAQRERDTSYGALERIDLQRLRARFDGLEGPQYWRSLEELAETDAFGAALAEEFPALARLWNAPVNRRQMLKLMAASMALAGLTGCDRQPPEVIVPYVEMPEYGVPAQARFYATSSLVAGYAHGLLAEAHEGRPTKMEGNPEHPATLGACDVQSQAQVLSLYDPDRSHAVLHGGEIASDGELLSMLVARQQEWDASDGAGLCFLTGCVTSPSQTARLEGLLKRWPKARWYAYDPIGRGAVYVGSRLLCGRALEPIYRFGDARLVLSLDADFLNAMPGFLRHAHDFMAARRPRDSAAVETTELARLYVAESTPSITGAVGDHVERVRHPEIEAVARQLARALGLDVDAPSAPAVSEDWITAVADDLRAHRGAAVVVPGDQQTPAVHAIAQAINHSLDAYGRTVIAIPPVPSSQRAGSLSELTARMHAGEVDALAILDANPVYSAPAELAFDRAYRRVPWRLHWGMYRDETAQRSTWHVPAAHPLESWSDARAYDGTISMIQPLIEPLYGGRTALQILAAFTDSIDREPRELLREYWRGRHQSGDFEHFWRQNLSRGFLPETATAPVSVRPQRNWSQRLPASAEVDADVLLQLRPDPAIWDGSQANNAWLQELPRPLTKLTWTNALLIGPALAEAHGLSTGDKVAVVVEERRLVVPAYILPGMPKQAATLHLGYGRTAAGRVGNGIGHNAYALRPADRPWAFAVALEPVGEYEQLPTTQNHQAIMGRDMIRVAGLDHYREAPEFAHPPGSEPGPPESLYPEPSPGEHEVKHAWAMTIDLSACIGCNACVTACQAENNIPVVGPDEVRRGHEMHWIRVDRYFKGPLDGPDLVFQPVPCMHCENAPCEYVCPVAATQHSASGLNEMIYNRCIGTRDCSQNCPYKVRRFNWFGYTYKDDAYPLDPAVRNPDVSVRAEGVMEKCTYCVQRIKAVTRRAEAEDRPIAEGELQTACQQACPTKAIVFGDLKAENSEAAHLREHELSYAMLEHLNTRPRTTYLAAVRNWNPALTEKDA